MVNTEFYLADFNSQSNSASNSADVHISNGGHKNSDKTWRSGSDNGGGGKISHSGNVDQSISQSNSITASNSGTGGGCGAFCGTGTATALDASQVQMQALTHSQMMRQTLQA